MLLLLFSIIATAVSTRLLLAVFHLQLVEYLTCTFLFHLRYFPSLINCDYCVIVFLQYSYNTKWNTTITTTPLPTSSHLPIVLLKPLPIYYKLFEPSHIPFR